MPESPFPISHVLRICATNRVMLPLKESDKPGVGRPLPRGRQVPDETAREKPPGAQDPAHAEVLPGDRAPSERPHHQRT